MPSKQKTTALEYHVMFVVCYYSLCWKIILQGAPPLRLHTKVLLIYDTQFIKGSYNKKTKIFVYLRTSKNILNNCNIIRFLFTIG